ncbi:MAG: Ger(x)C family spore germination protein [Clostridiaceae bacterium]|nr:Ger(x)C family spore germination protein [Clostridiaceae bacterium]
MIIPLLTAGCFDSNEIGDYAYVTALGIEHGISDTFRFTFQISKFGQKSGSGGESEGGGGEENKEADILTLDASSLLSAVAIANSSISKELNFMHLKAIVISEELATNGMLRECVAPIVRYRHIRRTTNMVVSKGTAEEFIAALKPYPGELITQTLEELFEKSSVTGYFPYITLNDLYYSIKAPYNALIITYGSVNNEEKFESEGDFYKGESDVPGNYYAGDIPRKGGPEVELLGSSVFDGDKMVCKLTGFETQMLLLVRGELKSGPFSISDPEKPELMVPIDIKEFEKPIISVDLNEGKPKIQIKLRFEGDIAVIQSGINYESPEKMPIIEKAFENYLVQGIKNTFEKCKDFKADVFNFGTTAIAQFWTIPEWEEYNWLSKFPESELEVEADFTIRRTGKVLKSEPIFSSEGKE